MIRREELIDSADVIFRDATRLSAADIRELQDSHNVNQCDECDSWLDSDSPNSGMVSIISEDEFFERYVF